MIQIDKIEEGICLTMEIMYVFLHPVYGTLMPHLIAYEKGKSGEPNLANLPIRQRNLAQEYHHRHPGHHLY
jgi:hypothetical protein